VSHACMPVPTALILLIMLILLYCRVCVHMCVCVSGASMAEDWTGSLRNTGVIMCFMEPHPSIATQIKARPPPHLPCLAGASEDISLELVVRAVGVLCARGVCARGLQSVSNHAHLSNHSCSRRS
jgi:hypothetical protein